MQTYVDGVTNPGTKVTLEPEEALHPTGQDAYTPPSTPNNRLAEILTFQWHVFTVKIIAVNHFFHDHQSIDIKEVDLAEPSVPVISDVAAVHDLTK